MRDYPGIPYAALPDVSAPDFMLRLRNMLGSIDVWARDASLAFGRLKAGEDPGGSGSTVFGGASPTARAANPNAVQGPTQDADLQQWYDFGGNLRCRIDSQGGMRMPILYIVDPATDTIYAEVLAGSGIYIGHGLTVFDSGGPIGGGGSVVATVAGDGAATFASLDVGGASTLGGDIDQVQVIVRGEASQTASLQEWQDSGSNVLAFVSSAGVIRSQVGGVRGISTIVGSGTATTSILGSISITGRTTSLGTQNLLVGDADSAGLYRVSFYIVTTTGGDPGDILNVTLAWNDGTSSVSEVLGLLGFSGATTLTTDHDLSTANAYSHTDVVVRAAASTNITFTTTLTSPGAGTPAHSLYARIEALG